MSLLTHSSRRLRIVAVLLLLLLLVPLVWLESWAAPDGTGDTAVVTFSHSGGAYTRPIALHLTAADPTAAILYTTDGSAPTAANATRYTAPLRLGTDAVAVQVVRAAVLSTGGEVGPTVTASYLFNLSAQLPVLSLVIDPAHFTGEAEGIYFNAGARGAAWERPVHLTYVTADGATGFIAAAGLRIHGGASRSAGKKSLRLYFRQAYGQSVLAYDLFGTGSPEPFKRLVLHAGGQDTSTYAPQWSLLRNQLAARLALSTHADGTRSQPFLLFINGELWGIYYWRERIDDHFLRERYGVTAADLLDTPEHNPEVDADSGQSQPEGGILLGDRTNWDHLLAFVNEHDLADPANFAYVQTQVDLENLVDYTILQLYAGNIDWPNSNVNQFRPRTTGGRWRWLLWDLDQAFGYPPYANDVTMDITRAALFADTDTATTGRQTLLLRRLLANPEFANTFLVRTADLLNSTLAETAVAAEIETLATALANDITYETGRWPTASAWQAGLDGLDRFAQQRPALLRQQLVDHFGLAGTAVLTLEAAEGDGTVWLNGRLLPAAPWSGSYFLGTSVQVTAVPSPGYTFVGWSDGAAEAQRALTITGSHSLRPQFAPAAAAQPQPGDVVIAAYRAAPENWVELRVQQAGTDLRGWRVTDNDSPQANDEGSLILPQLDALAAVPAGTVIRLVGMPLTGPALSPPADDFAGRGWADGAVWGKRPSGHTNRPVV
jgi:hypothetical protein